MDEKREGGYSGILHDRKADRFDVGIRECRHDEIIDTGISVMVEVVGIDLNGMNMAVLLFGVRWDWYHERE